MPKGVIVLLVVIAVVFVISLAVGGSNHGKAFNRGDDPPDFIENIGIKGKSLTTDTSGLGTSCVINSATRVTVSGSCNLTMGKRSAFSRPLNMTLRPAGALITVRMVNGGEALDAQAVPGLGSQCFSTAIDPKGADVDLFCNSGPQCIVDLLQESC